MAFRLYTPRIPIASCPCPGKINDTAFKTIEREIEKFTEQKVQAVNVLLLIVMIQYYRE